MDSGRTDLIYYYSTSLSTHAVHLLSPITRHFLHCVVVRFLSARKSTENQFLTNTYISKKNQVFLRLQAKCEISGAQIIIDAIHALQNRSSWHQATGSMLQLCLSKKFPNPPCLLRPLSPRQRSVCCSRPPSVPPPVGWAGLRGLSLRLRGLFSDLKSTLNGIIWSVDGKINRTSSEKLHTSERMWQLICCGCSRVVGPEQTDASLWESPLLDIPFTFPLHRRWPPGETAGRVKKDDRWCYQRGGEDVFTSVTKRHPHRGYFQRGLIYSSNVSQLNRFFPQNISFRLETR